MEQKIYTDVELLAMVIQKLGNIRVPVLLKHEIGDPIESCMSDLEQLRQAIIAKQNQKMEEIAASQNMDGTEDGPCAETAQENT